MSEVMSHFGFLLVGAALMLFLTGLGVAVFVPVIDRWNRRFFIAFFAILLLYVCLVLTEGLIAGRPGMGPALEVIYYFDSLLVSLLFPTLLTYLLHCCGESPRNSGLFRLETALWIGFFAMLDMTPFTTWFYYRAPDGAFCRGPLYGLMTGFLFVMLLLPTLCAIRRRKRLSKRYYFFLVGLAPMAVAMLIHFFTPAFVFFGFGIVVCASSMFVMILSDQIEEKIQQQREIGRSRAAPQRNVPRYIAV